MSPLFGGGKPASVVPAVEDPEFWTIIATKGVHISKLKTESPTTNHFFNSAEVLAMSGADWRNFVARLKSTFGI